MKLLLLPLSAILLILFPIFSSAQGAWVQKANFPNYGRGFAVGFSIGTKGYIGTGQSQISFSYTAHKDFWEWDQASNVWTQKADFGGGFRHNAVGFSIGAKGYIGTGTDDSFYIKNDFWEWDQAGNTWMQKANLPVGRKEAIGFSIGAKGYIGTGNDGAGNTPGIVKNDFWEWDQATDSWTQKALFPGSARANAAGFSIGTKGYIGTGYDGAVEKRDFWEWDQAADTWTQKADFGGPTRQGAVGFSIANKGYIGIGGQNIPGYYTSLKDFWEWDQAANIWTLKTSYPGCGGNLSGHMKDGSEAVGFSIACHGYIGTGVIGSIPNAAGCGDFWEYTPSPLPPACCVLVAGISGPDSACVGNNAFISASGGSNYSWSTGATSATITVNQSVTTTYTVIVSDANGCSDIAVVTIPVKNCCSVSASISSDPSGTVCVGAQVFISASGGITYSWNTGATAAYILVTPSVTTTYSLTVTDANGCIGMANLTVPVDPNCTATGIAQLNDASHQITIWPNPSHGDVGLRISDSGFKNTELRIYDMFGEMVFKSLILNPESSVHLDLPGGIYYLRIKTDPSTGSGGTITQKLIINK